MSIKVNVNLAQIAKAFIAEWENQGRHMSKISLIEWFKQHKLEYIAHGGTRVCAAINDDYVVKIVLEEELKKINKAEYERYHEMDADYRKNFTAIYKRGRDYSYLLMERVIPNIGEDKKEVPRRMLSMIEDNWGFNFGRRKNGQWVALDYADYDGW